MIGAVPKSRTAPTDVIAAGISGTRPEPLGYGTARGQVIVRRCRFHVSWSLWRPPPACRSRSASTGSPRHSMPRSRLLPRRRRRRTSSTRALGALHDGLLGAGVSAFVVEHGRLWSVGVRGYAMIPDGLPLEEGVIGRAIRTTEVQLVQDVDSDADFISVSSGTVSELAIPLLTASGVVGVINIETPGPAAVSQRRRGSAARSRSHGADGRPARRASRRPLDARAAVRLHELAARAACDLRGGCAVARPCPAARGEPAVAARRGRQLVESTEWSAAGGHEDLLPLPALEALWERIESRPSSSSTTRRR